MSSRRGFTLIELMIVIAIIAIMAAIAIPGLLASQRASNERNASASLKTIASAQADMKGHDRDGNGISDFWTADVYALYGMVPLTSGALAIPPDIVDAGSAIKLIDVSIAAADGASQVALYGNLLFSAVVPGSTKSGYIYRAFNQYDDGAGPTPLLNDTDGPGIRYGATHDRVRFAFMAFPEAFSGGRQIFIIGTDNIVWKKNVPATYAATFTPVSGLNTDSTSSCANTGVPAFETAAFYPASPQVQGCAKLD